MVSVSPGKKRGVDGLNIAQIGDIMITLATLTSLSTGYP